MFTEALSWQGSSQLCIVERPPLYGAKIRFCCPKYAFAVRVGSALGTGVISLLQARLQIHAGSCGTAPGLVGAGTKLTTSDSGVPFSFVKVSAPPLLQDRLHFFECPLKLQCTAWSTPLPLGAEQRPVQWAIVWDTRLGSPAARPPYKPPSPSTLPLLLPQ